MELHKVLQILRSIAPEHLAEPWDKVGLHLGDEVWPIARVLLCIDLTEQVMAEAIAQRTSLIIAYHPPIFSPLARLTMNDWKQRILLEAAHHRIAIYSPHTALDAAEGGVNDWLCQAFGPGKITPIKTTSSSSGRGGGSECKVVVFVPQENVDELRTAMSAAGAGQIGNYDQCSFNLSGEGTFHGNDESNPAVGQSGQFERVNEIRMEMVCPSASLGPVIDALRQTHSYEEPAFDIYPLMPEPSDPSTGQGRIVELDHPERFATIVTQIQEHLDVVHLETAEPHDLAQVQRIGLCAGAGGSLLESAGNLDVFFTGEMRHHDVLDAASRGTGIILAGHTQTERPYLSVYQQKLHAAAGEELDIHISEMDQPPSRIV